MKLLLFALTVMFSLSNQALADNNPRALPFYVQLLPDEIYSYGGCFKDDDCRNIQREWVLPLKVAPNDNSQIGGDLVIQYLGEASVKYFYLRTDGTRVEFETDTGAGDFWTDDRAYGHTALDCTPDGWFLLPKRPFDRPLWVNLGAEKCDGPSFGLDQIVPGALMTITQPRLIQRIHSLEKVEFTGDIRITRGQGFYIFFTVYPQQVGNQCHPRFHQKPWSEFEGEFEINIFDLLDEDGHLVIKDKKIDC